MKKLRLSMILFGILISLPMAFVAWRTYGSLNRESQSQVRFFADQLLDKIEVELADLVQREEGRAVDEYRHTMVTPDGPIVSPLTDLPVENYILGYFQNNPDGSFQTPLVEGGKDLPSATVKRVAQLRTLNQRFNQRKQIANGALPPAMASTQPVRVSEAEQSAFADRFLKTDERKKAKTVLGQKQSRMEEISAGQARNLARQDVDSAEPAIKENVSADKQAIGAVSTRDAGRSESPYRAMDSMSRPQAAQPFSASSDPGRFKVEVAPLQTVVLDTKNVFVFRRIAIDGQIYRQGFVIQLHPFLDHLFEAFYDSQPIAQYTRLILNAAGLTASRDLGQTDTDSLVGGRIVARLFPVPFNFLNAEMQLVAPPPSPARRVLTLSLAVLGIVVTAGLVGIYYSAKAVMDLSERRSRFVSAVTHELKTPLTNIRMYVEMLEQGIAATPEREHEYLSVLASESARLSGLINNVLELSRLEKQTRRFDLSDGDLSDVFADVQSIMAGSLAREGFELTVDSADLPVFAYDREVLVQVLVNLMENSIKFGLHLPLKKIRLAARVVDGWVQLIVSDTGPGIPKHALKRVFDDFYRVDGDLTRTIGGTGIGLALVKKLILAVGGGVHAENNQHAGCTIILSLPANRQTDTL